MPDIRITGEAIRRLLLQNQFPTPPERVMVFGFRGMTPVSETCSWQAAPEASFASVDHTHLRCTVGLWDTQTDDVYLTLGSTAPHTTYIDRARRNRGFGANMNLTGRFSLVKGPHPWSSRTSHRALRQSGTRVQRRTTDDLDFDGADRVEGGYTANNLHCAWCQGPAHSSFASAGCTVVQGYPKCTSRGSRPATGDWASFERVLYTGRGKDQQTFAYVLLNGHDIARSSWGTPLTPRVRFGSRGPLATAVQQALIDGDWLAPEADGKFGQNSTLALMRAQEDLFGPLADDGICGPGTSSALGIEWPDGIGDLEDPADLEPIVVTE